MHNFWKIYKQLFIIYKSNIYAFTNLTFSTNNRGRHVKDSILLAK
jgi:hypothetical protein